MIRGEWRASVHKAAKSWTQPSPKKPWSVLWSDAEGRSPDSPDVTKCQEEKVVKFMSLEGDQVHVTRDTCT